MQSTSRVGQIFEKIRDAVTGSVESAEEALGNILETLSGSGDSAEAQKRREAAELAKEKEREAKKHMSAASSLSSEAVQASKSAAKLDSEL